MICGFCDGWIVNTHKWCDDEKCDCPYPLMKGGERRMIDTDKYEGHTEGPWFDGEPTKISNAISNAFLQLSPNEIGKANARLAVDAPLLLEEVKRLRGIIAGIVIDMDEDWRFWRRELKKVIE
tara:strand:+ start:1922 stop:2290 length:369 start_codon:yes stop_codon:yes gene_type:complete